MSLAAELARIVGAEHVLAPVGASSPYNTDISGAWRGLTGRADAVVKPASAEQVAALMAWLYPRGIPLVPRGGGSGVSGGACPTEGGVVCSLERMRGVLELAPELWRMHVEAGLSTANVHRLAFENGVRFPPDPGASEQSQIGGNVATNAGGPHAFKYGPTGCWVSGLEAVIPPGELVRLGGASKKDVAGYDLKRLLIGSEGTLGVITSVQLRLIPALSEAVAVVAFAPSRQAGCEAILASLSCTVQPSAIEFIEGPALGEVAGAYRGSGPAEGEFAVICELEGSCGEAKAGAAELVATLGEGAIRVDLHEDVRPLWRWREGVSGAVAAIAGGKVSEDVAVPVERLQSLLDGFQQIAAGQGLRSCAWGHGGDGNAHATLLVNPNDQTAAAAAERATEGLLELALDLGGTVSGEHGVGYVKQHALPASLGAGMRLHEAVKQAFDPQGLINPGKKGGRQRNAQG